MLRFLKNSTRNEAHGSFVYSLTTAQAGREVFASMALELTFKDSFAVCWVKRLEWVGHSRQWEQHMHLPIHSFIHPLSFPPSIYLPTYSPTCPPSHPPTCLPMYLFIHLAFDSMIINWVIQIPSGSPSFGWVLESSKTLKNTDAQSHPRFWFIWSGVGLSFWYGVFLVCVFLSSPCFMK